MVRQAKRVGESLFTIGGGAIWGPAGLTQAQMDRAQQQLGAAMERQAIAISIIRTRTLPGAGKEDAGVLCCALPALLSSQCDCHALDQPRGTGSGLLIARLRALLLDHSLKPEQGQEGSVRCRSSLLHFTVQAIVA